MALIKGFDDESIQSVGHLGIVAGAYDSLGIAKVIERTIPKTRHHNLSLAQKNLIPVRYHKRKDGCVFPVEITENMVRMKERDVIEKFLLGDSVMFHQPLFSEGPESFNPVDVNFPLFKFVPMIDIEMAIPTKHERIVSSPFICIHNRSTSYFLHRFIHQGFSFYISYDTD